MNTAPTVAVSVLFAAAAATAISVALRPNATPAPATDSAATLQREVAALQEAQAELRRQLAAIKDAPPAAPAPRAVERVELPTVSTEQVAAAVEAYLSKRSGGAVPDAASAAAAFSLETDFPQLVGSSIWDNPDIWKRAHAAGVMDEVIKQFEAEAAAYPNDTKKQMELARAYNSYLQMDSSKWPLSAKADQVYDHVLELDSKHWEARFSKAISYTFYPDFLGKKPDAIKHFELLVEQQESMAVGPDQAQTYLYLGNLLEQRDPARAQEIWARGARRHPDNAELIKKARR